MLRKAYKIFGRSPVGTSISVLVKGKEKVFYKKKGITKAKSKAGFCCFDTLLDAERFLCNYGLDCHPISLVEIEEDEEAPDYRSIIGGLLAAIALPVSPEGHFFIKGTIFAKSLRIVSLTYAEYEK